MGRSIDEQSQSHKVSAVLPRREFCSVRAAEGKRVRRGKAASETKERGRDEKTRPAREVVENLLPPRSSSEAPAVAFRWVSKSRLLIG
jgi:hypothetical protein